MSTLKLTTLSNFGGTKSVPADTVIDGSAKAWVKFNASSGTPVINKSFNVSSITDTGIGQFDINLTVAVTDTAAVIGLPGEIGTGCSLRAGMISGTTIRGITTNATQVSVQDLASVQISIFH